MGETSKSKQAKQVLPLSLQKEIVVRSEVLKFYPKDPLGKFPLASATNSPTPLLAHAKKPPDNPMAPSEEQLYEQCSKIRANVKAGKAGNIEIHFHRSRQIFDKNDLPLGSTAVKVQPWNASEPEFFFIKDGDTLDAMVFLGGDNNWAIMLVRDENGKGFFLKLAEFHMLSIQEKTDPSMETGLMTSYSWTTGKPFTSIIAASNLDSVRNLFVSSYLEREWQQTKDATEKSLSELKGGDENGQEKQEERQDFKD